MIPRGLIGIRVSSLWQEQVFPVLQVIYVFYIYKQEQIIILCDIC